MHFVGLGHSHIVALAKGAYALAAKGTDLKEPVTCSFSYLYDPPFQPQFESEGGVLNRRILEAASRGSPSFILASMGGNEHNVLSIQQSSSRYDFILGENPDLPLDENAEILPESVIRETLWSWMREKIQVVTALRTVTSLPIYQIEPPPPLPRERVLAYPKEFFRTVFDRLSMSSDVLRHKMWRVQTSIYREVCANNQIEYVPVSSAMIDDSGMLIPALCGEDASHANPIFGETMVREVLRRHILAHGEAT